MEASQPRLTEVPALSTCGDDRNILCDYHDSAVVPLLDCSSLHMTCWKSPESSVLLLPSNERLFWHCSLGLPGMPLVPVKSEECGIQAHWEMLSLVLRSTIKVLPAYGCWGVVAYLSLVPPGMMPGTRCCHTLIRTWAPPCHWELGQVQCLGCSGRRCMHSCTCQHTVEPNVILPASTD
jgi:hypothetical protein